MTAADALGFIDQTLYANGDNSDRVTWTNVEVLEMLRELRATLLVPGRPEPVPDDTITPEQIERQADARARVRARAARLDDEDGVCPHEDCPKPVPPGQPDCGSHEPWMT